MMITYLLCNYRCIATWIKWSIIIKYVLVSTCFMRCVSRSGSFIYIYCARGSCVTFTLPQVQN